MLKRLILFWAMLVCPVVDGKVNTTPQAPKFDSNHLERTELATEVPDPVDGYTYRVRGTYAGIDFHPTEVPLWSFSSGRFQIGSLSVGSVVELAFVRSSEGRHFYGFKQDRVQGDESFPDIAWIDGRFVEIAGQK